MEDRLREHYFLAVRMGLLFVLELYIVLTQSVLTGASAWVLLLLAFFIGTMAGKELAKGRKKLLFLGAATVLLIVMIALLGREFLLLGVVLCYEILSYIKPGIVWYCLPLFISLVASEVSLQERLVIAILVGVVYLQHDFVVESYRKQAQEDTLLEQHLKRNMHRREHEMQEEIRKNLLLTENRILEERAALSQTLHDKLGHNINGSVYQLEAIKVLMEKEPETSKHMIQAVIDQLRSGMDEIRAILRKERPKKHQLAMLQLERLCEECREKGISAKLVTEGELSQVPEKYLEIILDNAYEAISNSIKYAKCDKIEIRIHVMNQVIRCSIADNGVGCKKITDGMGLAGMRRRMREINGVLDFESEVGFTINMLLPL